MFRLLAKFLPFNSNKATNMPMTKKCEVMENQNESGFWFCETAHTCFRSVYPRLSLCSVNIRVSNGKNCKFVNLSDTVNCGPQAAQLNGAPPCVGFDV